MAKLLLNVVSVELSPGAKIAVGKQPYDKETLDLLRREFGGSYLFKRGGEDGNSILSVSLKADLKPLQPEIEEVNLSEAPWLLAPLALEALLGVFVGLKRPVLKWRPLRVVSVRPANLFPADFGLPNWLQRRIVLDFETRTVRHRDRTLSVVLACGVQTRNLIDASCTKMLEDGFPLEGLYVVTRRHTDDHRVMGSMRLAGRVTGQRGTLLMLDDHGDGPATIVNRRRISKRDRKICLGAFGTC